MGEQFEQNATVKDIMRKSSIIDENEITTNGYNC